MRRTLFTAVGLLIILGACKNNGQEAGIGPITTGDDCIVKTGADKVMGYNDAGIYTFKGGPYAKADRMSDKVSSAWIAFIKTGNPNCKELPAWEPFNPDENPTMVLDNTPELKKNHDAVLLKYW